MDRRKKMGTIIDKGKLYGINPLIKLISLLILATLTIFTFDFQKTFFLLIFSLIILLVLGKIPLKLYLKFLLITLPLIIGFSLFHTVVRSKMGVQVLPIGPISITKEGLIIGFVYGMRIPVVLNTSIAFALTTEPKEFVYSIQHYLKAPYVFTYSLYAALLIFHHLTNILKESIQALKARHIIKSSIDYIKNTPVITTIVLAIISKLVDDLSISMELKGFMAYPKRKLRAKPRIKTSDLGFLVTVIIVGTMIISY
ncbi:MAG: energy-coupling factor transporter transmembrane component T [Candidatus Bathyarchaeia archaeon]